MEMPDLPDKIFPELAISLHNHGWQASPSASGVTFFRDESVQQGQFRLNLTFDPNRLHLLPIAHVETITGTPADFPWHRVGNVLCHLDPDAIEWDPESPSFSANVIYVANRLVDEFHRLQKGNNLSPSDVEFPVHWHGANCYIDIPDDLWPPERLQCLKVSASETARTLDIYLPADTKRPERYSAFSETELGNPIPVATIGLKDTPLPIRREWPPKTLATLNQFLVSHDPDNVKAAFRRISESIKRCSSALLLLHTNVGIFGALLRIDAQTLNGFRRAELPTKLRGANALTRKIPITRFTFRNIDEAAIRARTNPAGSQPLRDYNIHLIGIGAVGSILSDRLVQAGAGCGNGALHLIDSDSLGPENLGRHLLGFPYLGTNKAEGVRLYLRRSRLATNVRFYAQPWTDPCLHADADLVIDATAQPLVATALSNEVRRNRTFSLITTAVEGEGWTAGAFLYRGVAGEACRTCMEPWPGGSGANISQGHTPNRVEDGCGGSYLPFRASSADLAAGIACDLACDWATQLSGKTYRAVRLPGAPHYIRKERYETPRSKPGCTCSR